MIIGNMEVAVHFKTIRNLTGITSGRFSYRVGFTHSLPSLPRVPTCPSWSAATATVSWTWRRPRPTSSDSPASDGMATQGPRPSAT